MQKFQYDIRSVLILIFVASIVMAIFAQADSIVSSILVSVLLANFAGAVTALIVTFVLRFPRDGGFRDREKNNDCGLNVHAMDDHVPYQVRCQHTDVAPATPASDE